MSKPPFCDSCGQRVEWHPTANRTSMPIDPEPHVDGRFAFNGKMQLANMMPGARPRMYRCHWDTCPKGAKPERRNAVPCGRDGCDVVGRHLHCFRCGSTEHLANECDGDA